MRWYYRIGRQVWPYEVWHFLFRDRRVKQGPILAEFFRNKVWKGPLQKDQQRAVEKADSVRGRIREVETVATDLFTEWEREIGQITTPSLQSASRSQLQETRRRFDSMHTALKQAERSMDPVLTQLKDYVLYLKHNLNAQAIASLKGESASIQTEIARLIAEMNASIAKADEFIKASP